MSYEAWRVSYQSSEQAARAAYAQLADASSPCHWTLDSSAEYEIWETSCGRTWSFVEGGPEDNNAPFCHGCGHPIQPALA